jgi:triosephosphate isomerase (TIM)
MAQAFENYLKSLVKEAILASIDKQASMTNRQTYVIANWKMNQTLAETAEFFQKIKSSHAVNVVVCPPSQLLYPSQLFIKQQGKPIQLGGQNIHWVEKGAYTGETSTEMLKDVGCEYVIVGHSERRQYFHEDDHSVNLKVKQALKDGLTPIICIGETLAQKEQLQTEQVLAVQISGALKDIESNHFIIAYEPVWAIGTGRSATAEQAGQTHTYIRSQLSRLLGPMGQGISILYGGSVNGKNAAEYNSQTDIDGVLVGGASLAARSFDEIIDVFAKGEQVK